MEIHPGRRYRKSDIVGELWKVRLSKDNSTQFLAILHRAGYIEVHGRSVRGKRPLRL